MSYFRFRIWKVLSAQKYGACTLSRVWRLATSRSCVVKTLRRSDLQLHQFVGQKITDEKYAC